MNEWRTERTPAGFVAIRSDKSRLIATVHDEWEAPLIACAPRMLEAIQNTINLARPIKLTDEEDLCYIITEYQIADLRESVTVKATKKPSKRREA